MKWMLCVVSGVVILIAGNIRADAAEFSGTFSGAAEEMPNDSPGTGTALVELDPALDDLRVSVSFSALRSPTTIAHIHCCAAPGVSAGVATTLPSFAGFPAGVTSGTYEMTFDTSVESTFNPTFIASNGGTPAGAEAALLAGLNSGTAYFNIHTMMFPAGEVRANLSLVAPQPTPRATFTTIPGAGSDDDDGCSIVGPQPRRGGGAWRLLIPLAVLSLARRRRR
jgi:hypothetical protein